MFAEPAPFAPALSDIGFEDDNGEVGFRAHMEELQQHSEIFRDPFSA
jgi:hypothetical protein